VKVHAVRLVVILAAWLSFQIFSTTVIVPEAFSQTQCQANEIERWNTTFDWIFSNCSGAGHYITPHTYSITHSGNSLQGSSLDAPAATINGTVSGNSWLIDKTQVLYFSSRFLIRKNKTSLAALFILLL